jgi:hypothetical protein
MSTAIEEFFDKNSQMKKLVLAYEYAAFSRSHQVMRDNEWALVQAEEKNNF